MNNVRARMDATAKRRLTAPMGAKRLESTPFEVVQILRPAVRPPWTVSTSLGAVCAVAALPAVGTGATLAVSGLEVMGFLEATALYTLAVAEVCSVSIEDTLMSYVLEPFRGPLVNELAARVRRTP